ncbi:MAG: hypothetical protein FWD03_03015 [Defluviitaleaceae bacterium]|nr:hypothetical protein [Defluviitaleaceae bacterium]
MDTVKSLEIEITPKLREKLQKHSQLYDFYGPLLTERQNICFTMHYLDDLSLSEIGEVLGITPQAVADQIKRTVGILQRYEDKLGLANSWLHQQAQVNRILITLSDLIENGYPLEDIKMMVEELQV